MSAALKLNLEDEKLSQKPPLGEKRLKLKLVWENPKLSAGTQKEKTKVKPNSSYGRVLYNYFRDYDPSTGRYITSDPIGLDGGINTYLYVDANPIALVDPFGLQSVSFCYSPSAAMGAGHVGFGTSKSPSSGFYPSGDPFFSPGEVRRDTQDDLMCRTVDTDQETEDCMERCRERRQSNPRHYQLLFRQCTEFVRSCAEECSLYPDRTRDRPVSRYDGILPGPLFRSLPGR